jgi:hypothetical protein
MKLYITSMSLFVLAVFYLPLVLWVLWKILKHPMSGVTKVGLTALTLMLAYAIPLGDVTVNSIAMAKVCPSAGLHIYKTVEVEGYFGDIGGKDTLERYPYRFIEVTRPGGQVVRYEKELDGKISFRLLDQPTAEYEVVSVEWHFDNERNVETSSYLIRNRISKVVLADYPIFNSTSGWMDRVLVYRWFGYGGRRGCHGTPTNNFIQQVLVPTELKGSGTERVRVI